MSLNEHERQQYLRERDPSSSLVCYVDTSLGSKSGLIPLSSITPSIFEQHVLNHRIPLRTLDLIASDMRYAGIACDMYVQPSTEIDLSFDHTKRLQQRLDEEVRAVTMIERAFGFDTAMGNLSEGIISVMKDGFEQGPSPFPSTRARVMLKPSVYTLNAITGDYSIGPRQIQAFNRKYESQGFSYDTTMSLDSMSIKNTQSIPEDKWVSWVSALRFKTLQSTVDLAHALGRSALISLDADMVIPEIEGEIHLGMFPSGGIVLSEEKSGTHTTQIFVGYTYTAEH